ncbi:MAG: hypothetical protein HOP12_01260 [Candidatus Eisenbacteria bacterium]|uniref:histidine kinase n=1 Tax=Eiseniibacteriota bacterium TaxID=2212470 RepID=A0A849SLJ5_UNCEI|nr:hypothetical protein [Candidatus Eisenbacteria bacterium]
MNPEPHEPDVFQVLVQVGALLRDTGDPDKIVRAFVRAAHLLLGADATCVVSRTGEDFGTRLRVSQPLDANWDLPQLDGLLGEDDVRAPLGLMTSRIERRGRDWGLLAVRRDNDTFSTQQRHDLMRLVAELSARLQRADRDRLSEVRERIDTKILRDLDPKDLYYQVLDGLHQLTRYDHSASLYVMDASTRRLELVAEQIAWRKKMKSPRIGATSNPSPDLERLLGEGMIHGVDRLDGAWREWTSDGAAALATLLDPIPHGPEAADAPTMGAMLIAVLGSRADGVGVLQLGARRPGWFGAHELEIVRRFVPAMSVALQRARATESIRRKVVDVERRAVFAHLARGVAHDVNNALGAVVPLVQQIHADLDDGRLDPVTLRTDLEQIERSLEVCQRIFTGMLRSARGASTHTGSCDVRRAIRNACDLLDGPLRRAGVVLVLEVEETIPDVRGALGEMEQLVLNLATNALEAMPRGGRLTIATRRESDGVRLDVVDTGRGIPAELLAEVDQPFVTTKENGTGLGLPTCRSIVSGVGGELSIESEVGKGTRVIVRLAPASAAVEA